MAQHFYVYEHWRTDKNTCFYVGKGCRRRAWTMANRPKHHVNLQHKLRRNGAAVVVQIFAEDLSEEQAFTLERQRIAYYRGLGADLLNRTDGGEGPTGLRLSEEAKAKISAARKGKVLSAEHRAKLAEGQRRRFSRPEELQKLKERNRGRKASPETIEKRAAKLRGRKMSEEFCRAIGDRMRGRKTSEETRAKLREANLGKKMPEDSKLRRRATNPHNKAVRCLQNGCVYISASEAARQLGVLRSHVAEICRGASARKSTNGYTFEYVREDHG